MHLADLPTRCRSRSTANRKRGTTPRSAIISVVSIASGWILLFCLWYFVFREKARAKRRKGSSPE